MAYVKNTWADGDIITAEKMNHLEDGVADGGGGGILVANAQEDKSTGDLVLSLTFREISEAIQNDVCVYIKSVREYYDESYYITFELVTYISKGSDYCSVGTGTLGFSCDNIDDYPKGDGGPT